MDFLEDLFDFGDRNHRNRGGFLQNGNHNDHHDDDHHDDHHNNYPAYNHSQAPIMNTGGQPGIVCRKCSNQTIAGAKFCHVCGAAVETIVNCGSCGSKLPTGALFCPQCGYKNG